MGTTLKAAALQLAKAGFKIFPVPPGSKKSYITKNNKSFGSGENWGMTSDLVLIEKYWNKWPNANIGLPTGWSNGCLDIETDTKKGHTKLETDGEAALRDLEKRLGKLPKTRMAQSPSGSIHRFYAHPGADKHIQGRAAKFGPKGVDLCADGQMAVLPPSRRPDGVYKWLNNTAFAKLPDPWLEALQATAKKQAQPADTPDNPFSHYGSGEEDLPTLKEVEQELRSTENDDLPWDLWNEIAMRTYASTKGSKQGLELFDDFSQRSDKYDRAGTKEKWALLHTSPPTQYGPRAIFYRSEQWEIYEEEKKPIRDQVNGHDFNGHAVFDSDEDPVDLWTNHKPPLLPRGLLPELIDRFAFTHAELKGSDPAGFAMAALCVCAAAIPDCIRLKPKIHEKWNEPPILWVALVGDPSVKKTPIFKEVMVAIDEIDDKMTSDYARAMRAYKELPPADRKGADPPQHTRMKIEDITPESAQGILADSKDGVICVQDEMSGMFGAIEKYGSRGAGLDRSFWIKAYNGQSYTFDRVTRGSGKINPLSICLLGGIQPAEIIRIVTEGQNQGLIQRIIPILLFKGGYEVDIPTPEVTSEFATLVRSLHNIARDRTLLKFTPGAQRVQEELRNLHSDLEDDLKDDNGKFAQHIGKYNGMFARLCIVFHCIEHWNDNYPTDISEDTAQRVKRFMHEYLIGHAYSFYYETLGTPDWITRLRSVGSYILSKKLELLTDWQIQASIKTMRHADRKDRDFVFNHLYSYRWLKPVPSKYAGKPPQWEVNNRVHELYASRDTKERERKKRIYSRLLGFQNLASSR